MGLKYYIMAPANIESGGPELAHQLCSELLSMGKEAYMYYYYIDHFQAEPVDVEASEKYRKYHTSHVKDVKEIGLGESVFIFNEGVTTLIPYINGCRKILWWLSVDNYRQCTQESDMNEIREQVELHLVQSYYAYDYVRHAVGAKADNILHVSDYIGEKYRLVIGESLPRMDIALYNPKKGLDKIVPLWEKTPWLKWVPLLNLSEDDMAAYMHLAKVYVDFGSHPGKDRIPREAASCGCCIITNRDGSAAYHEDVPIPDAYKFADVPKQYDKIASLLADICGNYEEHAAGFGEYRKFIAEEPGRFTSDVKNLAERLERA